MEKEKNPATVAESEFSPTIVPAPAPEPEEDDALVVEFKKPYTFEGKTFTTLDLSGLETLTAEDMIAASNYLTRKGNLAPTQEITIEYALFVAHRATGLPVEFFRQLPVRDAVKVKNRVTNYFFGED